MFTYTPASYRTSHLAGRRHDLAASRLQSRPNVNFWHMGFYTTISLFRPLILDPRLPLVSSRHSGLNGIYYQARNSPEQKWPFYPSITSLSKTFIPSQNSKFKLARDGLDLPRNVAVRSNREKNRVPRAISSSFSRFLLSVWTPQHPLFGAYFSNSRTFYFEPTNSSFIC